MLLKELNVNIYELVGVELNFWLFMVWKGIEICWNENIDFMLVVGGGSVIDCIKVIVVGVEYEGDVWDIINKKVMVIKVLLFGMVLILVVIGFEMNLDFVIMNWEINEKYVWGSVVMYFVFFILDFVNIMFVFRD